jgi:hypothetical protein
LWGSARDGETHFQEAEHPGQNVEAQVETL